MKKTITILFASLTLIIGSALTTSRNQSHFVDLYWFKTNTAGTVFTEVAIPDVAEPISSNRLGCGSTGTSFCGRGYTDAQTELNANGDRILKSTTAIAAGLPVKYNGR